MIANQVDTWARWEPYTQLAPDNLGQIRCKQRHSSLSNFSHLRILHVLWHFWIEQRTPRTIASPAYGSSRVNDCQTTKERKLSAVRITSEREPMPAIRHRAITNRICGRSPAQNCVNRSGINNTLWKSISFSISHLRNVYVTPALSRHLLRFPQLLPLLCRAPCYDPRRPALFLKSRTKLRRTSPGNLGQQTRAAPDLRRIHARNWITLRIGTALITGFHAISGATS